MSRKTSRTYGAAWQLIRDIAARRASFSIVDLPSLTRIQARQNCRLLVLKGELEIVSQGRAGRFGSSRTVYRASQGRRRTTLQGRTDPELEGLRGAARQAMRQVLNRRRLVESGLTRRGTVRQRKLWPELRDLSKAERHRFHDRRFTMKKYEAGLTARGTVRKLTRSHFPATHFGTAYPRTERELAWRELRASMNIQLGEQEEAA